MSERRLLPQQKGFTLVEALVALAISSLMLAFLGGHLVNLTYFEHRLRTQVNRDDLVSQIQSAAGSARQLKFALDHPQNEVFTRCVRGGGCTSFVASEFYPLTLFDPIHPISGPGWPVATGAAPLWYDKDGALCTPDSAACVISVETSFRAQCLPSPGTTDPMPTCMGPAEFVQVFFRITHKGDATLGLKPTVITRRGIPVLTSELVGP